MNTSLKKLNSVSGKHYDTLPTAPNLPDKVKVGPYTGRICIIGAGIPGLFIGMLLKYVGITDVHILEGSDRVGGRLYTHYFTGNTKHNYNDIGAMRDPQTYAILDLDLQPYIYNNPATPVCYWYRHVPVEDEKFDEFMEPIVQDFTNNFNIAFRKWLRTDNDNFSTRAFLMAGPENAGAPQPPWTYDETAQAELYDTSTGLFDQSFTETVIDYTDFQGASKDKWWRVEGGCQLIAQHMQFRLSGNYWPKQDSGRVLIATNSPVLALSNDNTTKKIGVSIAGRPPVNYDIVFNTTAMAPLQQIDLQGLELPDDILTGIRSLSYDRATKVAIKFSEPWWNPSTTAQYGGISGSDLPIRSVVYPSWNDGPDYPTVLIVSYTWSQDATRVAALVPDNDRVNPTKNDPVVKLCLQNFVKLWSGETNPPSYEHLASLYMTHHAWGWENDPWTGGAYALFGPGQFKNVYPEFQPLLCKDKFAICGEAVSSYHAWISGSLDSAYIKTNQFLCANGLIDEMKMLKDAIFGGGEGAHPEEMDEELLKWTVLLGEGGGPEGWGDEWKSNKGQQEEKV